MKLISMTDFVLEQSAKINDAEILVRLLVRFASFLSQKLELWMFVPCKLVDGVWVVLEEPKEENYFNVNKPINEYSESDKKGLDAYYLPMMEFEEAKKRVLFEGFGYEHTTVVKHENYIFSIEEKTIESLIKIKCFPELTKTAQKQITI